MEILLLCLKIFFARIIDVSLGTLKTVFIVKEKKVLSGIIAFIEVFIWFLIAREALNTDITSIFIPISYSAGYASGTFIGTYLSRFIKGHFTINIISSQITKEDVNLLKENGFGVTVLKTKDHKTLLIMEIDKKRYGLLKDLVIQMDKKAFIYVSETKIVQNGYIK